MHSKPDLRVFLKWMIYRSGSVIVTVMCLLSKRRPQATQMNQYSIQFEKLFDADALNASGECPWTFFAYPKSLALANGLPPDAEVCELFGKIQSSGIDVAIWVSGLSENTTHFACRYEDRHRLQEIVNVLESDPRFAENSLTERSEALFAKAGRGT